MNIGVKVGILPSQSEFPLPHRVLMQVRRIHLKVVPMAHNLIAMLPWYLEQRPAKELDNLTQGGRRWAWGRRWQIMFKGDGTLLSLPSSLDRFVTPPSSSCQSWAMLGVIIFSLFYIGTWAIQNSLSRRDGQFSPSWVLNFSKPWPTGKRDGLDRAHSTLKISTICQNCWPVFSPTLNVVSCSQSRPSCVSCHWRDCFPCTDLDAQSLSQLPLDQPPHTTVFSESVMALNQILFAPLLSKLQLRSPSDPTWGRYLLPWYKHEVELEGSASTALGLELDWSSASPIRVRSRRVFIGKKGRIEEGEDVFIREEELRSGRGRKWVFYKVWENPRGRGRRGWGSDIVICHGMLASVLWMHLTLNQFDYRYGRVRRLVTFQRKCG